MPSRIMLVAIVAIAIAAAGFLITKPSPQVQAQQVSAPPKPTLTPSPTPKPTPSPTPSEKPKKKHKPKKKKAPAAPVVSRSDTYVVVYNNSGIHGLAAATAARAQGDGWNVVGSDNWYGTIPASTIYYPERLAGAARLLASDLGISRLHVAIDPMQMDRLTVILTG